MVDPKTPADYQAAIELLYFAYRAFTSRPDRILEQRGLGRVHHRILYFVGRHPSIAVNELLGTLKVSKQALNAPLRQLIEMNLVSVEVAPHDRRVKQLSLTEEGRQLEAQLTTTQVGQLSEAFANAGDRAAAGWLKVMKEIASSD